MNNSRDRVIPEMMGTEHELSVVFKPRDSHLLKQYNDESYDSPDIDFINTQGLEHLYDTPTTSGDVIWENPTSSVKVIKNGSVFMEYNGRPLEIATPECSSPKQLVAYSIASRILITEWARTLLDDKSDSIRSISIHDRVIDAHGNTWGEHDNYSFNAGQKKWGYNADETPPVIWLHALTRGCVTGAGFINGHRRQWTLSQKLPTVTEISNKKWGSTGFFNCDNRLEVRCSDKNVSQWSHVTRIGSMAMVMALAHTGFDTSRLGLDKDSIYDEKLIGTFDLIRVNKLGGIEFTSVTKIANSIQRLLSEACLEAIEKGDIPDEYKGIASGWHRHCDLLESEFKKAGPLDLSQFMYTDWAAKFYLVEQKIKDDIPKKTERSPFDYTAMAQDLYYDRILLDAPEPYGKIYEIEGTGYKLNKRIPKRSILGAVALKDAINYPPSTTRASERVQKIVDLKDNDCHIDFVDWDMIEWIDENNDTYKHYFQPHTLIN